MRRRTVLAAVGALATGSGCARVLGTDPIRVRVMRAPDDRVENATRHCTLDVEFVENHPVLERVVSSSTTAPRGEWVTAGTELDVGKALAADLREHCEEVGGIYHFDGERFVVRVEKNGEPMLDGNSSRSETIRARQSTDAV